MVFKETKTFTRTITELLTDEHYVELQKIIIRNPEVGLVIPGSGGIRKIRWRLVGQGKRGGIRIIYYWFKEEKEIYMLYAYKKNQQDDLTKSQLSILKECVTKELIS